MQEVVLHLQRIRDKRKMNDIASDRIKGLKRSADKILNLTSNWMSPSTYFISITQLLENTDNNVKKQVNLLLNFMFWVSFITVMENMVCGI